MIAIHELSIGNWVLFAPSGNRRHSIKPRQCEIIEIHIDKIIVIDKGQRLSLFAGSPDLQPISLNRDMLVRRGFEKSVRGEDDDFDRQEVIYHKDGIDIYDHEATNSGTGFSYATYTRYPGKGFKGGFSISSLHQLDNIYSSLTGRKLILQKASTIH